MTFVFYAVNVLLGLLFAYTIRTESIALYNLTAFLAFTIPIACSGYILLQILSHVFLTTAEVKRVSEEYLSHKLYNIAAPIIATILLLMLATKAWFVTAFLYFLYICLQLTYTNYLATWYKPVKNSNGTD